MKNKTSVRILVGCHKPCVLLKSDILTPIHCGRALTAEFSKDGAMSKEDYEWMVSSMIGDDTGDNISARNRHFAEMSAIYWAWKNYDKLGNPDYVGFCQYRRLLDFTNQVEAKRVENGCVMEPFLPESLALEYEKNCDAVVDEISKFDIIHGNLLQGKCTCYDVFKEFEIPEIGLKEYIFHDTLSYVEEKFPDFKEALRLYSASYEHYCYNCFVMKKELFMEYCSFIFPVLLEMEKRINYHEFNLNGQRILAYVSERLTGLFVTKKKLDGVNVGYKPVVFIEKTDIERPVLPKFKNNNVCVVLSSDNNYAPYLSVTIQSLISHASKEYNYDICVLENGLSPSKKEKLLTQETNNVSVRFINIKPFLADVKNDLFYVSKHFTVAAYFRLFIPRIFKHYDKVLYIDCDLCLLDDVAKLYQTDLKGKYIAASMDIGSQYMSFMGRYTDNDWADYLLNSLKMDPENIYFNSGVLVFDVQKLNDFRMEKKCLDFLSQIKPKFVDQCILNHVLQGHVHYLDLKWNVQHWFKLLGNGMVYYVPGYVYTQYMKACSEAKIIHYCDHIKPWNTPDTPLAEYWWEYARRSPFYEEIVYINASGKIWHLKSILREVLKEKKYKRKYLKYKILSKITFGKKRKKYKEKRREMKARLKEIKAFYKG